MFERGRSASRAVLHLVGVERPQGNLALRNADLGVAFIAADGRSHGHLGHAASRLGENTIGIAVHDVLLMLMMSMIENATQQSYAQVLLEPDRANTSDFECFFRMP